MRKGSQDASQEIAGRAKEYIEEHYTEKFSLDAVADALYINKIYLSKSFKKATGSTLLAYHNMTRCSRAAEMLSSSDLHVEIIGSMVGYVTPSHFAKVFRSIYGCSPSEYRASIR